MPQRGGKPKVANPLKPPRQGQSLAEVAEETLEIIRSAGGYHANGRHVSIAREQAAAIEHSSYHPDPVPVTASESPEMQVSFEMASSLAAAEPHARAGRRVCVLNFASGLHPGGGFRTGARAQEESLARASGLFPTLTRHMGFYGRPPPGFHTDRMIYSPQVPVIRDDTLALLEEPFFVDFVTAAAVNLRGIKRKADLNKVEGVMQQRALKVLALCREMRAEVVVLGAWGTGVFRLDAEDVAAWFRNALAVCPFAEVVFAIPDEDKLDCFREAFEEPAEPLDASMLSPSIAAKTDAEDGARDEGPIEGEPQQ